MESRMEKYYEEDITNFERSKRNKNLYREVSNEISDLENLPIPDNSNEIDIEGLKEIVMGRNEYRKVKELENTLINQKPFVENKKEEKQERIHDINVLLANAKNDNKQKDDSHIEVKRNTNFLTSLDDANIPYHDDAIELFSESHDSKEKTSTSNTDSLPLDILTDLKGHDNTIVTDPIVKDEVTMIKKEKDSETFYSGSFNFSKNDFFNDEEDDEIIIKDKNHNGIKIFLIILVLVVLAGAIYFLLTNYIL